MPVSVVVAFESAGGRVAPLGHQLHGWLLNCVSRIDATLSDRLHKQDRAKPFSVMSVESPHGQPRWQATARVTSLDEEFGRVLVNLDRRDLEYERLGDCRVRVSDISSSTLDHPLARAESYEAMAAKAARGATTDTIALDFLTPTAFASENRTVTLFPHPHLVFRSLAGKWNRYAPAHLLIDGGLIDELGISTRVTAYDLRTCGTHFGGRRSIGFVGRGEFGWSPDGNKDVWSVAHLLADFALYAGVGQKTTMGMGQTVRRLEPWV